MADDKTDLIVSSLLGASVLNILRRKGIFSVEDCIDTIKDARLSAITLSDTSKVRSELDAMELKLRREQR